MGQWIFVLSGIISLIIGILWIIIPFLIMGTNKRLDSIHRSQQETLKGMKKLIETIENSKNPSAENSP